jgi:hypothetical protein
LVVDQVQASEAVQSSFGRAFLQMRGRFRLEGTAGRRAVGNLRQASSAPPVARIYRKGPSRVNT